MDFKDIAQNAMLEMAKKPIETRLCPDQYVGLIDAFANDTSEFPNRDPIAERPDGISCVIMILESPHIYEFSNELGPAKGKTGSLIRTKILEVEGLSEYSEYGLILMNAVQNQCSLGYPTNYYRDDIFLAAWENGAKEDFIRRLNEAFRPGDVIINCCTKGNNKEELRRLVHRSIPSRIRIVLGRTHPSSWHSSQNREFTWDLK